MNDKYRFMGDYSGIIETEDGRVELPDEIMIVLNAVDKADPGNKGLLFLERDFESFRYYNSISLLYEQ